MTKTASVNLKKPRNMEDVLQGSTLEFKMKSIGLLDEKYEHDDLIQEFEGRLVYTKIDDDCNVLSRAVIGHIRGAKVLIGEAYNRHVSGWEVCDAHSREMEEVHGTFLRREDYKEDLELDSFGDLLVIHNVEIAKKYRGIGLGLLAVRSTMQAFDSGCAMIALKPFPPQFANNVTEKNETQFNAAQKKLRDYWSRLGFIQYRDSDYFYRNAVLKMVPLDELLATKQGAKG